MPGAGMEPRTLLHPHNVAMSMFLGAPAKVMLAFLPSRALRSIYLRHEDSIRAAAQRVKHLGAAEGLRVGELGGEFRPRREQPLREAREREFLPAVRDRLRHWQFRMAAWTRIPP